MAFRYFPSHRSMFNRDDIIRELQALYHEEYRKHLPKEQAQFILSNFWDIIRVLVSNGKTIHLHGLGWFYRQESPCAQGKELSVGLRMTNGFQSLGIVAPDATEDETLL